MVGGFGSISTKTVAPDLLGRARHWINLRSLGLPEGEGPSQRYDLADLELLWGGAGDPPWTQALDDWPAPAARTLLPWAVVHAAIRAPVVVHLHADPVCTLADAPGGRAIAGELIGSEVAWVPYAPPGPGLARAIAAVTGPAAAIIPHLGLMAWGDATDEVVARAEALAIAAATRLRGGREGQSADARVAPAEAGITPADEDAERRLVTLRGRMAHPHPVVLAVDPSLRAVADRRDAERIVAVARRVEVTSPWDVVAAVAADPSEPGGERAAQIQLVPGIGQVSAGWNEPDARARGIVAAHAHRVAAALVDRYDGEEPFGDPGAGADALPAAADPRLRPDLPATGRIYIVTGAASGIGRDIARHLSALGAQLGLADINAGGLDDVADELTGSSGRPVAVAGDLTDETVVDGLVGATIRRFGGVDGAVLNAGVALPGAIRHLSAAEWRRSLEVNATSHFLLARRLLPVLEAQGLGGSLVFIGSKNMFSPGAGFGAYSASKAALAQLARVVAIEAGPLGVRSNIVNPDNVFEGSALWSAELRAQRAAVYGIRPEDLEAYYTQRNLMKVPITGTDIAKAVAFLLSDDACKTTACVLTVDGGVPGVFPR